MPEPRIEVTPEDIARVVARFYERVRAHPGLGPVFARHVTDWPEHGRPLTIRGDIPSLTTTTR